MKGGRLRGATADPRQYDARFSTLLEGKRDARHDRAERPHLAHRCNHAAVHVTHVKVFAVAGGICCTQVLKQHVHHWYSHLVTCSGIANHRSDFVDAAIERVHATDGHSLLAGTQPSLRKDALLHPSPECDVMEPEAQHAGVQIQKLFLGKLKNDICALRIPADGALIFLNDACSRLPVHVLWRVKHRVTLHRSPVYSIDGNRWSF